MKYSCLNKSVIGFFPFALIFALMPVCHARVSISGSMTSMLSEESSHARSSVIQAVGGDIAYLLKQPDFYTVIGGLSLAPSLIEYESPAIDRKWMRSVSADHFFEAGEKMGDAMFPFAMVLVSYSLGKCFHSPKTLSFRCDRWCHSGQLCRL